MGTHGPSLPLRLPQGLSLAKEPAPCPTLPRPLQPPPTPTHRSSDTGDSLRGASRHDLCVGGLGLASGSASFHKAPPPLSPFPDLQKRSGSVTVGRFNLCAEGCLGGPAQSSLFRLPSTPGLEAGPPVGTRFEELTREEELSRYIKRWSTQKQQSQPGRPGSCCIRGSLLEPALVGSAGCSSACDTWGHNVPHS